MSRKPKPPVAEIAAALSGRGRRGHSGLYWWLWDHFDQLHRERQGRADWVTATEEFNKLNLAGLDKPPLKPDNVRKTWERVVRDRAREPQPTVAIASPSVRIDPPRQPGSSPVAIPVPDDPARDDDDRIVEPRHRFSAKPGVSRFKPKEPN